MTKKKTKPIQVDKFMTRKGDIIIEEEGEKPQGKKDERKNS